MNRNDMAVGVAWSVEDRFRLLVDTITDYAIYMLNPEGYIATWNAGAEHFKGYKADEILGEHFSRFYPEEDRQAGLPARALAIAKAEGRFENEGWRIRKDGSRFWAHVIIDPVRTPDGLLVGYAKITRDLTERRQAEMEIKQSQEQFRILVQGVTDYAIYMLDPEGKIVSWNAGAQRIKGYSSEEIIGQHFSRFYAEEDRLSGEPQRGLVIATRDGRFEKEGWRLRKDGTRFWASVVLDAIRDESGRLIGFAKVTRDISEKMKTQRALEKAREELFQAQKMEAIGQLTGGIAHDFNNLLMAVLGSLEIARKRLPHDTSVIPLIDNAIQGAQRGAALTQRMLAFSRRQELQFEQVDVNALLSGMSELLQRSLGQTVSVDMDLPDQLPPISSDPNQLETAILNLALNGRDAMSGKGQIRISARQLAIAQDACSGPVSPGHYVCIAVVDSGEGMDPETLQRATTPFFTTKGIGKGTGLGLSMVLGLTEQSGGKLLLKSEKGQGTTVELWFPVNELPVRAEVPDESPLVRPLISEMRLLTVLAVDDDGLVLMNTKLMLQDLGHRVLEADSGLDALAILQREPVDLVICDHVMPRMTGSELATAIHDQWPDVPIILATGYAELPTEVREAWPRLAKPFSQSQLAEAIARTIH
ncbi:PAS domain-containing sensor histidine kinase [Neorhizobium sp. P12A]|nr:PAS domain-containing sensor histidine kinase [Neorhizobium sp. P12A]